MSFSFSFSGDDIEDAGGGTPAPPPAAAAPAPAAPGAPSAFPVQGKAQLPPTRHDLGSMLAGLPSKVAYGALSVDLDGQGTVRLPRRELWDVRVQLMAEEGGGGDGESEVEPGLGKHDVKTGIYEGGFKSWESSVDLVKVLYGQKFSDAVARGASRVIELGCGTALPTLALFHWACASRAAASEQAPPLDIILADYNPSVLFLVTLPNLILTWAVHHQRHSDVVRHAFTVDGELELTEEVLAAFRAFLAASRISLSFLSGGWSPGFVEMLYGGVAGGAAAQTLILGAETIYSPFALGMFTDTLVSMLQRERAGAPGGQAAALVAAKRLYFGVGGSLDDFVDRARSLGVAVTPVREETEGVRRGVVKCALP